MTVLLLRASHANQFELQNYVPIAKMLDIRVITSHHPLTPTSIPTIPLWSPTDLPSFPYRRQLLNRTIGGEQWLVGLEKLVKSCIDDSNHRYKEMIVHTAETYTPYTHQAVQLRKSGLIKKLICTCWETIPHANEKFARLHRWKQEAYQYVDLFHTPTSRAKQALVTEGVAPSRIVVIPYGVDLAHFHPHTLQGQALKGRKPRVIMVARPVGEKGVDIFYSVAERLSNIAAFHLVTSRPYADMPDIYRAADILLMPSRTTPTWEEQYGMALVEAMATGLPIITSTSGAIPEIVGDAGIKLQEFDTETPAKEIVDLIQNPPTMRRLGQRARSRARKLYDATKIANQLATLYN